MRDAQGPRDELELSLTEALSPFFDIKSITFASPDVKPRPTPKTGWEETVLAYLLVRAKDASVDRIPPVEMDLKFVDLTGPVTNPAQSAETIIKIATDTVPPRPATKIEITQTLDTRQFLINGALPLEIKATASGLVPELRPTDRSRRTLKKIDRTVKSVNPHDGLQIKDLNTWGEQVTPTSERLWTIALDGDPIRAADAPTEFHFPAPKIEAASTTYQTYNDMNLATLPQPAVSIGPSEGKWRTGRPAQEPSPGLAGGCGRLNPDRSRRGFLCAEAPPWQRSTAARPRHFPHASRCGWICGRRPVAPPALECARPSPGNATRGIAKRPATRAAGLLRCRQRRRHVGS